MVLDEARSRGSSCQKSNQCVSGGSLDIDFTCAEDPAECNRVCFQRFDDQVEDTEYNHWWGINGVGYWKNGPLKNTWYRRHQFKEGHPEREYVRFGDVCTNDSGGGCWKDAKQGDECKDKWCQNEFIPEYMYEIVKRQCPKGSPARSADIDVCANENDGGCWNDNDKDGKSNRDTCVERWCKSDITIPAHHYMEDLVNHICPKKGETARIYDICANPSYGGCWSKPEHKDTCIAKWCDRIYFPTYMSQNFKRLCPADSQAAMHGSVDDCASTYNNEYIEYWNDHNDTCVQRWCKSGKKIPSHLRNIVMEQCPKTGKKILSIDGYGILRNISQVDYSSRVNLAYARASNSLLPESMSEEQESESDHENLNDNNNGNLQLCAIIGLIILFFMIIRKLFF